MVLLFATAWRGIMVISFLLLQLYPPLPDEAVNILLAYFLAEC